MANGRAVERGALGVFKFLTWVVYAIAVAAMIVLAFAFVLLLFAAKPTAGFSETIYRFASDFMDPFKGMIAPTEISSGGVIAWSMLIAIAAYAVLAWILGMILAALSRAIYRTRRPTTPPTIAAMPVATSQQPTQPTFTPARSVSPATPSPPAEPAPASEEAPAPTPAPALEPAPEPAPEPPSAPPAEPPASAE